MRFLEDLLSITATRLKLAEADYDGTCNSYTAGKYVSACRAFADVATAVATHKHPLAASAASLAKISATVLADARVPTTGLKEIADRRAAYAATCLKAAEKAKWVAHAAKAQVRQLENG